MLSVLSRVGTPEALLALCRFCSSPERRIAQCSREHLAKISYRSCSSLIDYLLRNPMEEHTRGEALELIHQEKPWDILRYVLQNADELSEETSISRWLLGWLRQARVFEEWVQHMLVMPRVPALKLAASLRKVDTELPMALARLVQHPDTQKSVRALDLLGVVADDKKMVPLIINAAMGQDPQIRSKAILVLGRTAGNFSLMKKAFGDWDDRVRANTVEALWGVDTPQARQLLWMAADDYNNRVRANAVKGLHELGEKSALSVLDEMLASDQCRMRMSAAWLLGEIGTSEMLGRFKPLLTDTDEAVQRNAISALEKIKQRSARP